MDRVLSLNGAASPIRGATPGVPLSTRALPTRLVLLEDEALARLVARGSGRAFGVLYERYQQPLYTYCYLFLHDPDDAYDALQSTLTYALAALRRGDRDELFRPWLFRIANREAHTLAHARAASEQAVERVAAPDQPWVRESAEERARLAQLVEDLRELPELQRSALLMRELTGLSHQEIATSLGITRLSARQAIFHARRSLEDFREGRDLVCEEVRRMLSHEDGRLLRRHVVRSHLRDCQPCTDFADSISRRRSDLHAVAPVLPAALAAGLLTQLAHTSGLGAAGATAGAAGKGIGASIAANAAKAAAVGAIALSAGAGVEAVRLIEHSKPAHGAAVRHAAAAGAPRGNAAGRHAAGAAGARSAARTAGTAPAALATEQGATATQGPNDNRRSGSAQGAEADGRPGAGGVGPAGPGQELQGGEGTTQPGVAAGGGLRLVGGSHPSEETPPSAPHEGSGTGEAPQPEGVEHAHEGVGPGAGEGPEGAQGEGHGEGPAAGGGSGEAAEGARGHSAEDGLGGASHPEHPDHPVGEEAAGEAHRHDGGEGTGAAHGHDGEEGTGAAHGHDGEEGTGAAHGHDGERAAGEAHGHDAEEGAGAAHGHGSEEAAGEAHGRGREEAAGEAHGHDSEEAGSEAHGHGGDEAAGEAHGHRRT